MTKQCLILGYGSAGQRHANLCRAFDLEPFSADPNPDRNADTTDVTWALLQKWDYAVIASPPEHHLHQIRAIGLVNHFNNDPGCKILCEKPLCLIEQQQAAYGLQSYPGVDLRRVMVAYNWRYHPSVIKVGQDCSAADHTASGADSVTLQDISLVASQWRELPPWGLLADHVSHDIDIISSISPVAEIGFAMHWNWRSFTGVEWESWQVNGKLTNGRDFSASESVASSPVPRQATLSFGANSYPLSPDKKMFMDMWRRFMSDEDAYPTYDQALATQYWLQEISKTELRQRGERALEFPQWPTDKGVAK